VWGGGCSTRLPGPGNGRANSAALLIARRGIQAGRAQGVHSQRLSSSPERAAEDTGPGLFAPHLAWASGI